MKIMKEQFLLLIDGPMGGGKSTVADLLKSRLENVLFTGLDRLKWSIAGFDRSPEANKLVAHLVESLTRTALEEGISVCVEQGFMRAEYMEPYLAMAKEFGVKPLVYQVEAPRDVLLQRLAPRKTPVEAKTPMTLEKIEKNLDNYFENKYSHAKVIDSQNFNPEQIVEIIFRELPSATSLS